MKLDSPRGTGCIHMLVALFISILLIMSGERKFSAYVWVDSGAHEATLQALPFFDVIHKRLCQGFIEEYEFLLTS